jgi:hypothetical protein
VLLWWPSTISPRFTLTVSGNVRRRLLYRKAVFCTELYWDTSPTCLAGYCLPVSAERSDVIPYVNRHHDGQAPAPHDSR